MQSIDVASAERPSWRLGMLGLGVVAASTSSILIRLAEAPPLVTGTWRLTLAWMMLAPLALGPARAEWRLLTRREWVLLVASSLALAAHFGTWITSLSYTTVASSVVLVTTTPIFVAFASWAFLRQPVGRRTVLAIAVAMAGSTIVGYGDLAISGLALLGDLLALLGAVAMAAHLMLGQAIRRRLSTLAYVWPCYGLAALWLALGCLAGGQPLTGYGPTTYLAFALLALLPQVLGHSLVNWSLGHLPPLLITLAVLGEPIGASLMAYLVLGEAPPLAVFIGGPLTLIGVYLAAREDARSRRATASSTEPRPSRFLHSES